MKNLVNFLKTRKGLLVLTLIVVAAAAYYYTTQVKNSKVESTPAGPTTSESVETAPIVPSTEATDKAVLPTTIENEAPGSTDDPINGSTDSPTDPVDGEEIHPVSPEDGVKVNPTSKFDDPTSYYEPTITGVDLAVWALSLIHI